MPQLRQWYFLNTLLGTENSLEGYRTALVIGTSLKPPKFSRRQALRYLITMAGRQTFNLFANSGAPARLERATPGLGIDWSLARIQWVFGPPQPNRQPYERPRARPTDKLTPSVRHDCAFLRQPVRTGEPKRQLLSLRACRKDFRAVGS